MHHKYYDQEWRSLKRSLKNTNLTILTVNSSTQMSDFFWGLRKLNELNQIRILNFLFAK